MRNDYTNYLMHRDHKYIDRKWVRGKWQYIYDEKLGGKEKKVVDRTQSNVTSATNNTHNVYSHPQSNVGEYTNAMSDYVNDRDAYGKNPLGKCESFINSAKNFLDSLIGNKTEARPDNPNRPRARKKNETSNGSGLAKRGSANTGKPVGEGGNVNERFNIRRR